MTESVIIYRSRSEQILNEDIAPMMFVPMVGIVCFLFFWWVGSALIEHLAKKHQWTRYKNKYSFAEKCVIMAAVLGTACVMWLMWILLKG